MHTGANDSCHKCPTFFKVVAYFAYEFDCVESLPYLIGFSYYKLPLCIMFTVV